MYLRNIATGESCLLEDHDFPRQRQVYAQAFADQDRALPLARPLYDTIVRAYGSLKDRPSSSRPVIKDLFSATAISRRLIYSMWAEYIRRQDEDLRSKVWDDEESHHQRPANPRPKAEKGVNDGVAAQYGELLELRIDYRNYHSDLSHLVSSFRARGFEASNTPEDDFEEDLWNKLEAKLKKMREEIAEHMGMYVRRASMEESLNSKQQARSAFQPTLIATMVVPCTFVASILSMGGECAAGESLFGVYWAISIPVTCLLLGWVLFGQALQSRWRESLKPSLSFWQKVQRREVDEEKGQKRQ